MTAMHCLSNTQRNVHVSVDRPERVGDHEPIGRTTAMNCLSNTPRSIHVSLRIR